MLIQTLAVALLCITPMSPTDSYRDLLKAHVKDGQVNYRGIEKSAMPQLKSFLLYVSHGPLPKSKNDRLGFYFDAYNALVIHAVIEHGRPRSVLDVKGFFDQKIYTVNKKDLTLDALEKKVINPYAKDPRTHFVLVCGAVGCPKLEATPFLGSDVDQRMNKATRNYLGSPFGAQVKPTWIRISRIFDWYKADFGGSEGVLRFVRAHLPAGTAQTLKEDAQVQFIDYNWTLNQR